MKIIELLSRNRGVFVDVMMKEELQMVAPGSYLLYLYILSVCFCLSAYHYILSIISDDNNDVMEFMSL